MNGFTIQTGLMSFFLEPGDVTERWIMLETFAGLLERGSGM